MPDLLGYTTKITTSSHGFGYADNFKTMFNNQADVGRELVIRMAKAGITDDDIMKFLWIMTQAAGKSKNATAADSVIFTNGFHPYAEQSDPLPVDTVTVAAIGTEDGAPYESGVTGAVYFRCQTTGDPNIADAAAELGATITIEAHFAPLH